MSLKGFQIDFTKICEGLGGRKNVIKLQKTSNFSQQIFDN